ncbi:hypothetical protein SAMN05216203_3140 [Marinobacter daqiaonensis]|uniref:DUF4124 domain-containing protein n=1 Tax=Marinobacter daqiaonensis TaxID=650891 RepID=A0A1I6JQ29_9GAMM|nr:DUF4124 domain-containing protein [Marinobacter daqiaonensis]SFR81038.1 hypothetical protein SAMN05216203_3140 [Marinobacter daqiaonensis]
MNPQRRNTPFPWLLLPGAALLALMELFPGPALAAEVYRCEGPEGIRFSDRPCGPDPETITIPDNRIGGSLNHNLPEFDADPREAAPDDPPKAEEEDNSCRYINSTRLRTYLAREQVVPGMTRDHVERAFGKPPEKYQHPVETWVYQTRYYGALYELTYVYFRNGCVTEVEYRDP